MYVNNLNAKPQPQCSWVGGLQHVFHPVELSLRRSYPYVTRLLVSIKNISPQIKRINSQQAFCYPLKTVLTTFFHGGSHCLAAGLRIRWDRGVLVRRLFSLALPKHLYTFASPLLTLSFSRWLLKFFQAHQTPVSWLNIRRQHGWRHPRHRCSHQSKVARRNGHRRLAKGDPRLP